MATATTITRLKAVPSVTYENVKDGVNLSLSHAEAKTLAYLLAAVGGAMDTARKYTQAMTDALRAAGYEWDKHVYDKGHQTGNVYFNEASRANVEAQ